MIWWSYSCACLTGHQSSTWSKSTFYTIVYTISSSSRLVLLFFLGGGWQWRQHWRTAILQWRTAIMRMRRRIRPWLLVTDRFQQWYGWKYPQSFTTAAIQTNSNQYNNTLHSIYFFKTKWCKIFCSCIVGVLGNYLFFRRNIKDFGNFFFYYKILIYYLWVSPIRRYKLLWNTSTSIHTNKAVVALTNELSIASPCVDITAYIIHESLSLLHPII